jgi:hypothetical protein
MGLMTPYSGVCKSFEVIILVSIYWDVICGILPRVPMLDPPKSKKIAFRYLGVLESPSDFSIGGYSSL